MNLVKFTRFESAATIPTDKYGRQHLLVVTKGTFDIRPGGSCVPSDDQVSLVHADRFSGEPGLSSVTDESDFASFKPMTDVILQGSAYAPGGKPVPFLDVTLQVGTINKTLRVTGDRVWKDSLLAGLSASSPKPFVQLPIIYERAFGGSDTSPEDQKKHVYERRNLVGVSVYASLRSEIKEKPLPNVEYPSEVMRQPTDRPRPAGFGYLGRSWLPRGAYAGTYDQAWLDGRFPFLPLDFDDRFFQGAPEDQVCPYLKGGETVRMVHLSPERVLEFRLPVVNVPVEVRYASRRQSVDSVLDTVLVRPDRKQVVLTWRARTPLVQKPSLLREVVAGEPSPGRRRAIKTGKRFVNWRSSVRENLRG